MKKTVKILSVIFLFASCTPQTYYQLVETTSDDLSRNMDYLTYENKDITVSYDFWGDHGNGSFIIHNKTDKDLFFDLKRSHLIINGFAYTYYQNRVYTSPKVPFFSSSSDEEILKQRTIRFPGVTPKSITDKATDVITFNEERIVCIPPGSSQIIFGFDLQPDLYRDCNLMRFPKTKDIVSSEFTGENTPFRYRNRITYGFSETMQDAKQIENEFWVVKITNLPENDFIGSGYLKYCSDSSSYSIKTYPLMNNYSFYYKYKLEPGRINH